MKIISSSYLPLILTTAMLAACGGTSSTLPEMGASPGGPGDSNDQDGGGFVDPDDCNEFKTASRTQLATRSNFREASNSLYLRGSFNSWEITDQLSYNSTNDTYSITKYLDANTHNFKIADQDWGALPDQTLGYSLNCGGDGGIALVYLNQAQTLKCEDSYGNDIQFTTVESGEYTFTFEEASSSLIITQADNSTDEDTNDDNFDPDNGSGNEDDNGNDVGTPDNDEDFTDDNEFDFGGEDETNNGSTDDITDEDENLGGGCSNIGGGSDNGGDDDFTDPDENDDTNQPSADADNGRTLYTTNCTTCHGSFASELVDNVYEPAQFNTLLTSGGMANVDTSYLSEQDKLDLIEYFKQ